MHQTLAFEELYKATSPYVFSILKRMLYSDSRAVEALQDVFVMVWEQSKSYEPDEIAPKTWIYNIARQHAIAELRKSGAGKLTQSPSDMPEAAIQSNVNDNDADHIELDADLKQLDKTTRHFISLAYREGFSYEELSHKTQQSVGSIKSRVRESLLILKESRYEH